MAEAQVAEDELRFEDLTVDDDLPVVTRCVQYISSQVALQRLVHVKMLAECAELAGPEDTQEMLVPVLKDLVLDPESIIRQHLAAQLLPIALVCMLDRDDDDELTLTQLIENPALLKRKEYDSVGHNIVTQTLLSFLNELIQDPDQDEVPMLVCPIPLRLVRQNPPLKEEKKKKSEEEQMAEELRITACNLLAELGGSAAEYGIEAKWTIEHLMPLVLELCEDTSFRVRRSAAQALPRIIGACTRDVGAVEKKIMPAFVKLSQDDLYRVRKATGECLVDMSRSLMLLSAQVEKEERKKRLQDLRRNTLVSIAKDLIQDSHKVVRQGMMQFLGPFMASFYPFQDSKLREWLPMNTESDGSNHLGIVAQFFPHATSMVSRLNSSQNAITQAPTPIKADIVEVLSKKLTKVEKLDKEMPPFINATRVSKLSLSAVCRHREQHPPDAEDLEAILDSLLDYFAALSMVSTGDENTDAEMRVYCAYSFPAIVLLLGKDNWNGPLRQCFHTLLNPTPPEDSTEGEEDAEPPLPVKRCLASSLHTMAHILGSEFTRQDIMPSVEEFFLKDSDESVRLNIIRNFPFMLELLEPKDRNRPFVTWSEVVRGEEFLGAKKRSATNPLLLNWRQRSYLARSLVDLFPLIDPQLLKEHGWPVLEELLVDNVSNVRDDALWAIPILLQAYSVEHLQKWPGSVDDPKKFSSKRCHDVESWLKKNILKIGSHAKGTPHFQERQLFCRICGAMALMIRFSELHHHGHVDDSDEVAALTVKFKKLFHGGRKDDESSYAPYQKMHGYDEKHIRRLLEKEFIPHLLEMQEDRISNVRLSVLRTLALMPYDIRKHDRIKSVLRSLEEEAETWESFGEVELIIPEKKHSRSSKKHKKESKKESKRDKRKHHRRERQDHDDGPVDVDNVSMDASVESVEQPSTEQSVEMAATDSDDAGKDDSSSSGGNELNDTLESNVTMDSEDVDYLVTVVFEDGPIGMQLEPTSDETGCRVYGFLDSDPDEPSAAKESGMINIGDVLVRVNGEECVSYDQTIDLLKAGGRREIVFRPGMDDDTRSMDSMNVDVERSGRGKKKRSKKEGKKESRKESKKKDSKKESRKESKKDKKNEAKD